MKIFDCTTYFDEELLMDVRFNILNEKVEKFIVVESCYSHSGKKKSLNFNIDNYKKFKDKIIYIVIEKEPDEINRDENPQTAMTANDITNATFKEEVTAKAEQIPKT